MKLIAFDAPTLYRDVLAELVTNGTKTSPRGMGTREFVAAHLALTDPRRNIVTSAVRKLNYPFMVAEWLYILSGANRAEWLTPFNKSIGKFAEPITGEGRNELETPRTFRGAYGPKVVEQLPYVISTLMRDPASRQAVLTIWRERPGPSLDIPCTVSLQFVLRDGELQLITYMRSNDAWLGLPYDLFNFTQIQRLVAWYLGAQVGTYHHMVGSLHLYEGDIDKARAVIADEDPYGERCQQADWDACPIDVLVGGFVDVASQAHEPARIRERYEHKLITDEFRDYLNVLLWRFDKNIEPGYPWHSLTTKRRLADV